MTELKLILIGASVFQRNDDGMLKSKSHVVNYVQEFSQYFRRVIWGTSLFTGEAYTQTVIDPSKVSPCILGGGMVSLISDYFILNRIVDKKSIIFLHLPNPWLSLIALVLKRKARKLFVYVANDYIQHSEVSKQTRGVIYSMLYRFIHELLIRYADGVIVRGKLNLERALQLNSNAIETIPIGLRTVHFKRNTKPCSGRVIRILYVGKIVQGKGVEVLLKAFNELSQQLRDKDVLLTIVGTGSEEVKMKRLVSALGISDRVTFLGFIDDESRLSKLYAEADVLVVPSYYPEGVPRVIDEALLHGTPVIASDLEGIRRQFSRGEIILVSPGDVIGLTNALYQLIYNHGLLRGISDIIEMRIEETRKRRNASEQHAKFILADGKHMKFYENPRYVNHRRSTAHFRRIHSVELSSLFQGKSTLELGCGANPQDHLSSFYVSVDISFRALKYGNGAGYRVQADAQYLPFKEECFEAVLTNALLEHIEYPELVLNEIIRILCPGGIAVHLDAWNVPSWRSLGLPAKPFRMLKCHYKILKAFLPILESLPIRVLRIFPKRIIREIRYNKSLDYQELTPNYDLPEVSDADACCTIDSHSVLLFYKTKGFELIRPRDRFLNRLFHRGLVIVNKSEQ